MELCLAHLFPMTISALDASLGEVCGLGDESARE